ncbi:transposable element Tcb2 transposase [Trichonephila clavipes]|nr:transposable element Tcb2 transposase [Trichonephila clavipes]
MFQQYNYASHKSRLATGWLDDHSFDFSVLNWPPRNSDSDVLEQRVKSHHTAPTNITELWTVLVNIYQFIPLEPFQKLVESMTGCVAAVTKAKRGSTRY